MSITVSHRLYVPPWVQAHSNGRFFPDSAEDFAFHHFNKMSFRRKSEMRRYKAGYDIARYRIPETQRKSYDQWSAALYEEVKKYVKVAPCARFRDPRRVPLFQQYAILLNFAEVNGNVRHEIKR